MRFLEPEAKMPLNTLARFVALAGLSVALYSFSMRWGIASTGWTLATDFDLVLHTSEPSVRGSRFVIDGAT